jgi:large subunit ribosomal protein L3
MEKIIKGKKVKMTQVFSEDGKVIPVTMILSENKLDIDLKNKNVIVTGISKGKGFAGVMKRWGFRGGQATRGQSNKPRQAGSIGAQTPGRVFKGKKMAGRLGNDRVTIKGLKIVDVIVNDNIFMLSGPVPGAVNAEVKVTVLE